MPWACGAGWARSTGALSVTALPFTGSSARHALSAPRVGSCPHPLGPSHPGTAQGLLRSPQFTDEDTEAQRGLPEAARQGRHPGWPSSCPSSRPALPLAHGFIPAVDGQATLTRAKGNFIVADHWVKRHTSSRTTVTSLAAAPCSAAPPPLSPSASARCTARPPPQSGSLASSRLLPGEACLVALD